MKFTATSYWDALAKGGAKYIQRKVYIKKTSDLTEALTSGTWVEITTRLEDYGDVSTNVEYDAGQFSADTLTFTGTGITWFKANVFNAAAYIELKIEVKLGSSESNLASDTAYIFNGIVDKHYSLDEKTDTITFTAYGFDDLMSRLAGENITTQYINPAYGASGGLILRDIPGLWATDANVASYVLKAGVHTLTYEYNGGSWQAKLDDGDFAALSTGSITLVNGDADQKLTVYCISTSLPTTDAIEKIVVVTEGTTIPSQFYRRIATRRLITKCLAAVGIGTVNFGTINHPTFDAGNAVSFLGQPPDDETVRGYKQAICSNGTDVYLGISEALYQYDVSAYSYTLCDSVASGWYIRRLFYNARNGQIWIIASQSTTLDVTTFRVYKYTIYTDTLSGYSTTVAGASLSSMVLMDYNYTGASYKYGICYVDDANFATRFVDSATGDGLAIDQAGMGYGTVYGAQAGIGYIYTAGGNNGYYGFHVYHTTPAYTTAYQHVSAAGAWVFDVTQNGPNYQVTVGTYDPDEDKIYYWDATAEKIKNHAVNSASTADVLTLTSDTVSNMYFGNSKTYFTTSINGSLYSAEGGSATLLSRTVDPERTYTKNHNLVYNSDRLYGLDEYGTLFQLFSTIEPFIEIADGDGLSVRDLMTKAVNGAGLIYAISHAKSARVIRRTDGAGTLQTSGSSLTVGTTLAAELSEEIKGYEAVDLVSCSNANRTRTYDGTNYDSQVLSDARRLEITNDLMPTSTLKDKAKFLWDFHGSDHILYAVPLGAIPLFQYELLDGVTMSFSSTKIVQTGNGVIYGAVYGAAGDLTLHVLI